MDLELQRKSLPSEPGIYFFKDKTSEIIYIGKASNLRKRVSQYFLKTSYRDPYYEDKIKNLVNQINSIDYIVTENEKEALILENIQIKKHNPRFNVIMRDSKSYPWVAIFYGEEFPRIRIIRNPEKYSQKAQFLGPYTDKKEIQRLLRDLRKIFPYCTCKKKVKKSARPCLYYQLNLCPGPCVSAINKRDYHTNVKNIELFLKGETEELKNQINKRMFAASEDQNYELAAFWRNKLEAIENTTTRQYVLLDEEINKDIIGYDIGRNYVSMVVIHIREGRITNKSPFTLDLREKFIRKKEIFSSLIEQYYQNTQFLLPDTIIVPKLTTEIHILKQILTDIKSGLQIRTPKDEKEEGLIRIAHKNAKVMVEQQIRMEEIKSNEEDYIKKILSEAKKILNLPKEPRIIEGFDISNIQGTDATGSMVYFLEGKPFKKNYRYYKIRSKSTPDDVAMMREVIERRYLSILRRDGELPDLILVDGGKAQLNAAVSTLKKIGIDNIPVIGLAKRFEEIFTTKQKNPIILPEQSPLLKLFQKVRDEAHRFAVKLHKKQRKKHYTGSILDQISGIGPATRNKLLNHFGSVEEIKKAQFDDLIKVVNRTVAKSIVDFFNI
jgi:excinuclease ABC subunit C